MHLLDRALEKDLLPDQLVRVGIRYLLAKKLKDEQARMRGLFQGDANAMTRAFAQELRGYPIAIETDAANTQHYQIPGEFYQHVLGPHLKYSSGYWTPETATLAEAEAAMLELVCERAQLQDGQHILDLGCGWGSFCLYAAQKYPNATITALSNAADQRRFIEARRDALSLDNLTVLTGNVVTFDMPPDRLGSDQHGFDRIVSVEMFEHMKNYELLLKKLSGWLNPSGRLFVHIFVHRLVPYHFQDADASDWLTRYFFTGGTMPSDRLLYEFDDDLEIEAHWPVEGTHYAKTARAWLENMDANRATIMPLLERVYGAEAALKWWVYWRVFFMCCEELWGFDQGRQWHVSHYLLRPASV